MYELDKGFINTPFDEHGNYREREPTFAVPEDTFDLDVNPDGLEVNFHIASHLNETMMMCTHESKPTPIDYERYRPYFLHVPVEKVKRTFENTTRFATNVLGRRHVVQTIKSPYPAHNVWRRNKPVASDTIFAETAAIDTGGQKMAQVFVGRKSLVIDVFGMGSEKEFVNTLEDVIRKRGAMDKLITDSAQVEMSRRVKDILRSLVIDDWQSEAQYQHQNFAEHRWKHLKRNIQWYMNWRNIPSNCWLLVAQWCADVMNHTAEKSLNWSTPLERLSGQTTDISICLLFIIWDVVYVPRYKSTYYSGQVGSEESSEIRGHFVGFAWDVGHALTFKILTDDTRKIIKRSQIRLAKVGENNLKLDTQAKELLKKIYVRSKHDGNEDNVTLPTIHSRDIPFAIAPEEPEHVSIPESLTPNEPVDDTDTPAEANIPEDDSDDIPELLSRSSLRDAPLVETVDDEDELADHLKTKRQPGTDNPNQEPIDFGQQSLETNNPVEKGISPDNLIGRSFLMPPEEDGSRVRAKILEAIESTKDEAANQPEMIKFRALINGEREDVVAYNDIVDFIEKDESWDGWWKFKTIHNHMGPLKPTDKNYKGSRYNVLVEWETGEKTWEPLYGAKKSGMWWYDKVTIALYADKHNLLDTPGWKIPGLRKIAKTQKRLIRHANQAKLHSFRTKPVYQYGYLVPRNYQQAVELDHANGNTKWQDAIKLELRQIDDYDTFEDKGTDWKAPKEFKKINVHLVFAVKHDGRHKARLVAGGHLTDTPIDSVYSSVVSLRGIRMLAFIAELNGMEYWSTDIGNAYLESRTKELVYIKAGPEFGERAGHYLVIVKALYGLKSSGLRWSERLADVLRQMGFFPSKAEKDIWMRDMGDHYEYIAAYVDDLAIVSRDPSSITDSLVNVFNFKLKGTGPIEFHLGCDFFRDEDGVLCYAPRKYIEKLIDNYERVFGRKPKQYTSPLEKGDHPELDTSELLDLDQIQIYQSLIGALQWVVQIGRFDVATAVMTMSRFRAAPRQGHMDRVKRIHGYLSKMRHATVRIRTELPDFSNVPEKHYDWEYSVYKGAKELIPEDCPPPRGKSARFSSYVDANLLHDLISGKSVTGILHFANKTPIDWFTKLQSTVETATYGSEFSAARTCTDQIIDLRCTFRYLGVPIDGPHMMFGDNESVVNLASLPHSKLHKRHNILSYHRTREAIAAGIIRFHFIAGSTNPADILSKHWDYALIWSQLRPILFWQGDTAKLILPAPTDEADNDKAVPDATES